MAIIDITTFNGEYDLFELRYQILKDYVDEFIVIEFDKTFSGKNKPDYILESKDVFYDPIHNWPKVNCVYINEEIYSKYKELAESSPSTQGAEHWKREFVQKESIKDCLNHLKDDDVVFIGDCDEIWDSHAISLHQMCGSVKLKLRVYTYHLNNHSSEEFYGPILTSPAFVKKNTLNHLRGSDKISCKYTEDMGWHFTSLAKDLERKLKDSYTEETYAHPQVIANLQDNIENNRDFLGRSFTYKVDESEWPQYLKDNKEKYKHLCK